MKMLIVLSLMLAVLAFGNTAGACPLGVCMGDSIKPDKGWNPTGFGVEKRLYRGELDKGDTALTFLWIEGTRKHGACSVAIRPLRAGSEDDIGRRLERKYGRPASFEPATTVSALAMLWVLSGNPDKIARIFLYDRGLQYVFENHTECEKGKEATRKAREAAREAAEKARSKRIDAEL